MRIPSRLAILLAVYAAGFKVVGDIEVGPAVVVEIPPGGGMALGFAGDAAARGDIGERAVAIVVQQIAALTTGMLGRVENVGGEVDIEPAVAVVIAEGLSSWHCLSNPQSILPLFLKLKDASCI